MIACWSSDLEKCSCKYYCLVACSIDLVMKRGGMAVANFLNQHLPLIHPTKWDEKMDAGGSCRHKQLSFVYGFDQSLTAVKSHAWL
eukprot:136692-Amphidinium_carterae.1